MKAVRFSISIPKFLAARSVGRLSDWFVYGPPSGLELADVEAPELPGDHWVKLAPIATGVCGSDLSMLTFENSVTLEPFASFPAVLGHEILAHVVQTGKAVSRVKEGDRVVVDPTLSCAVRGFPESCTACQAGFAATCEHSGDRGAVLGRGMFLGAHKDLPGGWSQSIVAHETQLFAVPSTLSDDAAVLCEPFSIGMHAVLRAPPHDARSILVIGSGPIALGTIWALRRAGYEKTIVAQTKRKLEAELAKKLGANDAVTPDQAREALLATGARAYKSILGDEVFAGGGFPLVYDCVGSEASLTQAMRYSATRGQIVLLGCAAELKKLDMSFLWAREISLRGFICYGQEGDGHTFEITLKHLAESKAPVHELITHRFTLEEYAQAMAAGLNRAKSGSVKILLTPNGLPAES